MWLSDVAVCQMLIDDPDLVLVLPSWHSLQKQGIHGCLLELKRDSSNSHRNKKLVLSSAMALELAQSQRVSISELNDSGNGPSTQGDDVLVVDSSYFSARHAMDFVLSNGKRDALQRLMKEELIRHRRQWPVLKQSLWSTLVTGSLLCQNASTERVLLMTGEKDKDDFARYLVFGEAEYRAPISVPSRWSSHKPLESGVLKQEVPSNRAHKYSADSKVSVVDANLVEEFLAMWDPLGHVNPNALNFFQIPPEQVIEIARLGVFGNDRQRSPRQVDAQVRAWSDHFKLQDRKEKKDRKAKKSNPWTGIVVSLSNKIPAAKRPIVDPVVRGRKMILDGPLKNREGLATDDAAALEWMTGLTQTRWALLNEFSEWDKSTGIADVLYEHHVHALRNALGASNVHVASKDSKLLARLKLAHVSASSAT